MQIKVFLLKLHEDTALMTPPMTSPGCFLRLPQGRLIHNKSVSVVFLMMSQWFFVLRRAPRGITTSKNRSNGDSCLWHRSYSSPEAVLRLSAPICSDVSGARLSGQMSAVGVPFCAHMWCSPPRPAHTPKATSFITTPSAFVQAFGTGRLSCY